MQYRRAWPGIGPKRRRYRGHAQGKNETAFSLIPDRQAIFQHFEIRIVDSTIDQSGPFIGTLLAQTVSQLEKALPSSAERQTKVEVRNSGGFSERSERCGS